jgi:hypothetical protein
MQALEEYFWARREQALHENDIAKAFRYTDRFISMSAHAGDIVLSTVSSER